MHWNIFHFWNRRSYIYRFSYHGCVLDTYIQWNLSPSINYFDPRTRPISGVMLWVIYAGIPGKAGSRIEKLGSMIYSRRRRCFSNSEAGLAPLFRRSMYSRNIPGISSALSILHISEALNQVIDCLLQFPCTATGNEGIISKLFVYLSWSFRKIKQSAFRNLNVMLRFINYLSNFKISLYHGSCTCAMFSVSLKSVLNDCHIWKPSILFAPATCYSETLLCLLYLSSVSSSPEAAAFDSTLNWRENMHF